MKRSLVTRIAVAALALTLCAGTAMAAAPVAEEVRQHMAAASAGEKVPVIVRFSEQLSLESFARRSDRAQARTEMILGLQGQARRSQGPLQAFLRHQGVELTELWLINALAVQVPVPLVETLAQWPGVAALEAEAEIQAPEPALLAVTAPPSGNIEAIGVQPLWNAGFTGTGVVVASFDSGVDVTHPDLASRWRGGSNSWFDPYAGTLIPADPSGHGTAVTSLMVGGAGFGDTIGVAPDAQWIAAKIFSAGGTATPSIIIRSFQWALDPDHNPATDDAPDIINNSWGYDDFVNQCLVNVVDPDTNTSLRSAIQAVQNAGIHVVFAAGNGGPASATSISPGNYPESLAVGSIGPNFTVSDFSSRGPGACDQPGDVYPELVAPGEAVVVAMSGGGYGIATGTSYSTPHVAGALALLRSAVPPNVNEGVVDYRLRLEQGLLGAAADLGPLGADNSYGRGLVNVAAAYDRLANRPYLSIYDAAAPENDERLDFGGIKPETIQELSFVLKNTGGAPLTNLAIDSGGLLPPFSLVADTCTPSPSLATGAQCTLTVRFAPPAFASYSGQIVVSSSLPTRILTVAGDGNSLPPAAQLIAPANGATGVARPVTFSWIQGSDADGDPLLLTLFIDTNPHFLTTRIILVQVATTSAILIAGVGLLFHWPRTPRRRLLLGAALLAAVWLTVSCGGGGSSGVAVVPSGNVTVGNLDPNTTYYWKLLTTDSHGGQAESEVRSFTTQ